MANRHTMAGSGPGRAWVRTAAAVALTVMVLLPVAGCSGGSGGRLPTITATPSRTGSVTASALPSRSPESSAGQESTPAQSVEPSAEQSQVEPTDVVSDTPPATSAAATDDGSSVGWPIWALIALVLIVVIVGVWQHRSSRRRDTQTSFDEALSEARWLGRDLVPPLLTESRDERRGAWTVSRPRVMALENRLAQLATPGSESIESLNAQHLETAVIGVRRALDTESLGGSPEAAAEAIGAVKQAAQQLDQTLTALGGASAPSG